MVGVTHRCVWTAPIAASTFPETRDTTKFLEPKFGGENAFGCRSIISSGARGTSSANGNGIGLMAFVMQSTFGKAHARRVTS